MGVGDNGAPASATGTVGAARDRRAISPARARTVWVRKMSRTTRSRPWRRARETICRQRMESTPRSKTLSVTPTCARFITSAKSLARVASSGLQGWAVPSSTGSCGGDWRASPASARRSILPDAVWGRLSSTRHTAGTM